MSMRHGSAVEIGRSASTVRNRHTGSFSRPLSSVVESTVGTRIPDLAEFPASGRALPLTFGHSILASPECSSCAIQLNEERRTRGAHPFHGTRMGDRAVSQSRSIAHPHLPTIAPLMCHPRWDYSRTATAVAANAPAVQRLRSYRKTARLAILKGRFVIALHHRTVHSHAPVSGGRP